MSLMTLAQDRDTEACGEAADVEAAEEIVDETVGVRVWTDSDEWAVSIVQSVIPLLKNGCQ